jgi:CRISPR-associated endonuclease/helicase Cas3
LPGRPLVADWLHGVEGWQPPETHVAWREEVGVVHSDLTESLSPQELLEDYPLKPHELLRDRTDRVMEHLDAIAARCPEASAWVVDAAGQVRQMTLLALVRRGKLNKPLVALQDCTVLLPPEVGGLTSGLLDGAAEFQQGLRYDVADEWTDENHARRRCRVWDDDEAPGGMRLVRTIDTLASGDDDTEADDSPRRIWRWFVRPRSADDDGSRSALKKQELQPHLETAERDAAVIVSSLGLPAPEALAVTFAARAHDRGKRRAIWQRAIGNRDPRVVLAKSGEKMQVSSLSSYRHELGSMLDLTGDPEFQRLPREVGDLVLHLVAAHHGRGRPHFPEEEVFDPEHEEQETRAAVTEVPRRFGRLQRRYGRWGLAYLESLVRSADALASQGIEPAEEATRVTGEGRRGRKDGGA